MENKGVDELVFGLMSGTSGDGLDIAACRFSVTTDSGHIYELLKAKTFEFPKALKDELVKATSFSARELQLLNINFSIFMASSVKSFIQETGLQPCLLASHGHTVFHQPSSGYTLQIGSGATLAAKTGIDTVCDFRQTDISLGGQGAPLVPFGDCNLFSSWDYCLNLGGFANITINRAKPLQAFDICAANLILNYLAEKKGYPYDKNGLLAAAGQVDDCFLSSLDNLAYYQQKHPKSLGTEWIENEMMPVIKRFELLLSTETLLCTYTEHIARQIGNISSGIGERMLVTGGGAWNKMLVNRIKHYSSAKVFIPDAEIVNFKEALIFAYLGWLRVKGRVNTFASVTGASSDTISGAVYLGKIPSE